MHLADFSGAPGNLLVREKRGDQCPDIGKSKCETLLESGTNGAATHLIQRIAIPPAIHIRFPETKRPGSQHSAKNRWSYTSMSQARAPLTRMSASARRLVITSWALYM